MGISMRWIAAAAVLLGAGLCRGEDVLRPPVTPESREILLAADGVARYALLLPAEPDGLERFAADELRQALFKLTGAEFAILRDGDDGAGLPVISVGDTARFRAAGLAAGDLGRDGAAIAVAGEDILLYGHPSRGPLFAAYMLLEEDFGVRFYTDSAERYPDLSGVAVTVTPRRVAPAFPMMRDVHTQLSFLQPWGLRNRLSQFYWQVPPELGGNIHFISHQHRWWFGHSYDQIVPHNEACLAEHPEWFMLDANGERSRRQICPSNPEVQALAAGYVVEAMQSDPAGLVCLGQSDNGYYCRCVRCLESIARHDSTAAPHYDLVNAVARAVTAVGLERQVIALAYQKTGEPPADFALADNVVIWLCTDLLSVSRIKAAELNPRFMDRLRRWGELAGELYIWDYYVNFYNFFAYEPSLPAMAANLRLYRDGKVTGVLMHGALQTYGSERQGLKSWVLSKLLWNPGLDLWELERDYLRGVFGEEAGGALEPFYRMLFEAGDPALPPPDPAALTAAGEAAFADALAMAGDDAELRRLLELEELPLAVGRINHRSMESVARGEPFDDSLLGEIDRVAGMAEEFGIGAYSESCPFGDWLARIRSREGLDVAQKLRTEGATGILELSGLWRFLPLTQVGSWEDIQPELPRMRSADFNDADWAPYLDRLGVGWEEQGYPGFDGAGMFRQRPEIPESWNYPYTYLCAMGVDEEAVLYWDGNEIGAHTEEATGKPATRLWAESFSFRVPPELAVPGPHTLAIECFDSAGMGGIYLPLFLIGSDRELSGAEIIGACGVVNPFAGYANE